VATIGSDNRVALKPVTIARDLGDVIEISSGLAAKRSHHRQPPDGVGAGDPVRIAPGSTVPACSRRPHSRRLQEQGPMKPNSIVREPC